MSTLELFVFVEPFSQQVVRSRTRPLSRNCESSYFYDTFSQTYVLLLFFFQSLDSLETSIQKLLSELYPPFEATAPTLLSQLFQLIDSRYKGDALRCLLDFLVPAKHILDTVRQAACVSDCLI